MSNPSASRHPGSGPGLVAPDGRLALALAIGLVWLVNLAVRMVDVRTLARILLHQRTRLRPKCPPDHLAALVALASTWCWPRPSCLTRALVLGRLLVGCGLEADVVLGVDRGGGGFAAHAWVECDGRTLGHDPHGHARFAPLCRIGRRGAVVTSAMG